ncbi:MAG TPA: response regulator transcription factor, partial [Armatimonadota bacterium]|nr:response regulator transcription factor [Armatimonadota bacterium]
TTLDLYAQLHPDLVIMDISMPGMNGIQATECLKRMDPAARIVVLSAYSEPVYLRQLLAAGASGYVPKKAAADALLTAVQVVGQGGIYLDPSVAGSVGSILADKKVGRGQREGRELSEREREVLLRVAQGYTNKQIATQMCISVKTVESHKSNIAEKTGFHGRADSVRYALQQGWLQNL